MEDGRWKMGDCNDPAVAPTPSRALRSSGLLVRNVAAGRTIDTAIAIRPDKFWRPAMRTQAETQFACQRGLGHPKIAFRFIKKGFNVGRLSVPGKLFARNAKFF